MKLKMMTKSRFYYYLCISVVLINACKNSDNVVEHNRNVHKLSDSLMQIVSIDTVKLSDVYDRLNLSGKVSFDKDNVVNIFPMFSGLISEVRAELGDYVKKGDVLAVIRSSDIADYKLQEKEAQSRFAVAQRNFDVVSDMNKSGLSSDRDVLTARTELDNAQTQLNKLKEVFSIYSTKGNSEYIIKSPISGFIIDRNINLGMQLRTDNSTAIFTVSNLEDVWILANVYESDISRVDIGDDVEVRIPAYPDLRLFAKIDKIFNFIDDANNTLTVRIKLKNDKRYMLKPGMFTKIDVICNRSNERYPCIDNQSLIFDKGKYYVVVVSDRNLFVREVSIKASNASDMYIPIISGLQAGEHIINKNALLIYNSLISN